MKGFCARFGNSFTAVAICAMIWQSVSAATIRVSLKPPNSRTKAPTLALEDASGHTIRLSGYRGKVVALNFWATDCGGCRLELPSFVEVDKAYRSKGLAVLGVSMDISYEGFKNAEQAWSKVKPFIHVHRMRYTILMGDDTVANAYHIEALPATYLIDTSGRIAAVYIGVVNKENLESNIRSLLLEHQAQTLLE